MKGKVAEAFRRMQQQRTSVWVEVCDWACRHIGIELVGHESAYPSAFKHQGARIGERCPLTNMYYRIPTKGHYAQIGKPRCYILWDGHTLNQVQETFAYVQMLHDGVSYVLLRARL
jgi:hypothetical protein